MATSETELTSVRTDALLLVHGNGRPVAVTVGIVIGGGRVQERVTRRAADREDHALGISRNRYTHGHAPAAGVSRALRCAARAPGPGHCCIDDRAVVSVVERDCDACGPGVLPESARGGQVTDV